DDRRSGVAAGGGPVRACARARSVLARARGGPVGRSVGPGRRHRERGPRGLGGQARVERSMVNVLLAHCYYRLRGGEDLCFEAERSLLQAYGAQVISFTRDNGDIGSRKGGSFLSVAPGAALRRALEAGRPPRAHFHN